MAEYRRRNDSDTWHWCTNCNNWPRTDFVHQATRPSSDLCNECKAKEKDNNCKG